MCGIAGIVDLEKREVPIFLLKEMNDAIKHRGPDDEGYILIDNNTARFRLYSGKDSPTDIREEFPDVVRPGDIFPGNIGLSHRRFSIIDLSSRGHQPFMDKNGACCVVFNGEIYNYLELRETLSKEGVSFRTESDTEVLLESYKRWGLDCFAYLNGFWAMALYDFRLNRLILSRDRVGKKPLYWTRRESRIYFASEIKSLLKIPEVSEKIEVNEDAIFPWIALRLRDLADSTFFKGIHSLPAASYAVVNNDFPGNAQAFWAIPKERLKEKDISVPEACSALRRELEESVRVRLRADVPWCVELSGGLDSSALVAIASQINKTKIRTYTVRFEEKEWNEEPYARSVANRYGVDYQVLDSPRENFWSQIVPFTYLEEEPYHAPNLQTNQLIWTMMRENGTKVSLNGAAGDELFAGYSHYFFKAQYELLRDGDINILWNNALNWTEGGNKIKSLGIPVLKYSLEMIRKILPGMLTRPNRLGYLRVNPSTTKYSYPTLHETLISDMVNTQMPYWLRSGDKGYMGIPFEVRAPFLDYNVVELAFRIPISYQIREGWHKWILRKALEDLLPPDVVWRCRKMGFPFPFERFYRENADLISLLLEKARNPYLDFRNKEQFKNHWRVLSFILWYEMFINKNVSLLEEISERARDKALYREHDYTPCFLDSCRFM